MGNHRQHAVRLSTACAGEQKESMITRVNLAMIHGIIGVMQKLRPQPTPICGRGLPSIEHWRSNAKRLPCSDARSFRAALRRLATAPSAVVHHHVSRLRIDLLPRGTHYTSQLAVPLLHRQCSTETKNSEKYALKRRLEPGLGRNDLRRLVLDLEVPARLLLNILGTTVM